MPTALVTLFAFDGCSDNSSDSGLSGVTSAATDSPSTTWLTTDGTTPLTTDGTGDDSSSDPPDGSTGTDGSPPPPGHPPWDPPRTKLCGGMDNDDVPTGEDVLVLDGCVRVTPELVENEDKVRSGTPRCSFVNRLGSVGVDVSGDGIRLLYCDSDHGGGVRFATVNVVSNIIGVASGAPDLPTATLTFTTVASTGFRVTCNMGAVGAGQTAYFSAITTDTNVQGTV